jgi:hypothetical protein
VEESLDKRLDVARAYLRRKGADPDLAPLLLEQFRASHVSPWWRAVELVFIAIGVYSLGRYLIHLLLGF